MAASLTPENVTAHAQFRIRLPFAFGHRFYIALIIGFLAIVPVWWSPRLIALFAIWDLLVLAAWLFDYRRLPSPGQISATRIWTAAPQLARPLHIRLEFHCSAPGTTIFHAIDATPAAICPEPPSFRLAVAPGQTVAYEYVVSPRRRGDAVFGDLYLRYGSPLAFAERWAQVPLHQTVCVLPDLAQANEEALFLIRSRQIEIEKRRQPKAGAGRDFESLREYRQGDDVRHICWSATARRRQIITRTYEAERSQAVWLLLDAGRLLRAEIVDEARGFALPKLDYAVNAALALANVASQFGDRVGILAYGRTIQQVVGLDRGPRQLRRVLESLAHVHHEAAEANHALAARTLLQKQSRRALVIWITDFAETPSTPDVVEYAAHIANRHLVLFAAVSHPDLALAASEIPATQAALFRDAAALDIVHRRELFLKALRNRGVLAMELTPGRLTSSLVNEYLEVKDRSLL